MGVELSQAERVERVDHFRSILVQRIEQESLDLPLLPQVASQVMSLLSDQSADAATLSSLIHQDQALAGHVLRIANSPAYMPRSPIVSLQQAIAWLGLDSLAEIAFTISIQNGIFRVPGQETVLKQLWRHALATGLYAKEIARYRRANVESAFLCGLLHAVGKPVLLHTMTDIQKELRATFNLEDLHLLMQEYHARAGIKLADKWNLPAPVKEAITYSSDYSGASTSKPAMITCLAARLATHLLEPHVMDEESVRNHPVLRDLNLYPEDLAILLEQGAAILSTADSMAL